MKSNVVVVSSAIPGQLVSGRCVSSSTHFKKVHPTLYTTVKKIFCYCLTMPDRRAQMFLNFRLSNRGSIRKPPHVFSWVFSLEILMKENGDADATNVIKVWNTEASDNSQLVGSKATAVRLVLTMPLPAKTEIRTYVGLVGWDNCPWNEDALSSKKIYPSANSAGVVVLKPKMGWPDRLRITSESMLLMVRHVHAIHTKQKGCTLKKESRGSIEEIAQMAALCINLIPEVQALMPITAETLQTDWVEKFSAGDSRVTTELMMALSEKSANFACRSITTLTEILDRHTKAMPSVNILSVETSKLEDSMWDLQMNQMKYDFQQFRVHKAKLENYFVAVQHIKLDWRKKAFDQNDKALRAEGLPPKSCLRGGQTRLHFFQIPTHHVCDGLRMYFLNLVQIDKQEHNFVRGGSLWSNF